MSFPTDVPFIEFIDRFPTSSETKLAFSSWANHTTKKLETQQEDCAVFSDLLAQIPVSCDAGCLPLACLAHLLSQDHGPFPVFDILRRYNELWLALPEAAKICQDQDATSIVQDTLSHVKSAIGSLPSLFESSSKLPALLEANTERSLTHGKLSSFVKDFTLPLCCEPTKAKPVIVLALPNGPLLGLACLAVSSYYTAAPLNTSGGAHQFRVDVRLATPQAILVLESDLERLGLLEPWVVETGISILLLTPDADMTFRVRHLDHSTNETALASKPNLADDIALLLFTSGTSGTKKVVPITCFGLLTGVVCVIDSWGLSPKDSCVNMMPLNHVGGLVRNLFAPILARGSTILCPAFDPNLFWDILQDGHGTWYYASPSMHMSILAEGSLRPNALSQNQIRLVCNAAGGLLPALATRLRDTFRCPVLPSYGMTECMPISTPPLNYALDRVGTSGVTCGPEITILDDSDGHLTVGQVGRICVRGGPTFAGYLKNGEINKSAFNDAGWFDTGDLGSLDNDGYLYLTGRGKEVINRGGELISPFEVEEAITIASQEPQSLLFQRVKQVMAFSAPHYALQEVVGVALVTASSLPRPDVRELQAALKSSLHSSKWPVVVVYIDALPTSNNKIVRIKFAERLDLEPITGGTTLAQRHFDAVCPPINSLLNTKIAKQPCKTKLDLVSKKVEDSLDSSLEAYIGTSDHDGTPEVFLAPQESSIDSLLATVTIDSLRTSLRRSLDGFLFPSKFTYIQNPFPRTPLGVIDEVELHRLLDMPRESLLSTDSGTEYQIRRAFAEVLGFSINDISSDSDFFDMGGDSLSAGRLLSILRRDLQIRIPVDQLFVASRVFELLRRVKTALQEQSDNSDHELQPSPGCTETYSSTNPLVLFVNLLPILIFYPMKLGLQWTVLMYSLSTISELWNETNVGSRFVGLVGAMFISRASTQIAAPFFGIAFKWIIIGRYREGTHPMWGPYHTRWWIVQKVLLICGKGVFRHVDSTRILYYRLLGTKIGKGVTIEKGTTLGEYDLLEIGDNVHLDRCICRPFAAERNTSMYLGKIAIGKNSSVGLKTHVAAGSILPEGTFIGANSSSYEMDDNDYFDQSGSILPKPHILLQTFFILPIQIVVLFVSSLPWMAGLFGIVSTETRQGTDNVRSVITWWATPHRIAFHYLAQALHVSVRPFIWFALVVIIKKVLNMMCGMARPIAMKDRTQKDNLRTFLLSALVPNGNLKSITKLFGSHYESTSIAVRAMGGKVGRRVYWPGTGPSIQDFDLVEIGDDVVFGSRSHITTFDAVGSDLVRIGNGAMIADRVILSPGSTVGDRTVLGSGAFVKRNQNCDPGSVWVGNRNGNAVCLSATNSSQTSTLQNFGNVGDIEKSSDGRTSSDIWVSQGTSICDAPLPTGSPYSPVSIKSISSPELMKGEKFITASETELASSSISTICGNSPSSPFGRAFYEGKAPYYVLGQLPIFLYSTFIAVFVQLYWNVGTISTIMLSRVLNNTDQFQPRWYRPLKIYAMDVALLSGLYTVLSILSLSIVIAAKWILLGRRKTGSYEWDKSSYCQRWQVFLTIEAIRRRCFSGNGIIGMLTGTHFCVLYFRAMGAKIGKDCALFAGGRPSLVFTEPDLLSLGDRVTTDDASLVCHINSRGNFSLNELSVGSRSVLRSGSRLLSGAKMGQDTTLLEHTLIMAGDIADDGVTYQGWPADIFRGDRFKIRSARE